MLKEIFEVNKDIVINSDIDGFLCGMFLQKYYNCRVVGFSNSRETVWLINDIQDIDSPVYIDLYVSRPKVICIEQHIIAYDKDHHNEIISYGTKLNPNLERKRTFVGDMEGDYYHKYPFGTVHYLMAKMSEEGINAEMPDLMKDWNFEPYIKGGRSITTCAGHVLLRADDALYSTLSPYRENALDWWSWIDPNTKGNPIRQLREFISTCHIDKAVDYKKRIGDFFKSLGCDGVDGAFKTITDSSGRILDKVLYYRDVICEIMGMPLNIPIQYEIHRGKYAVQFCRPGYDMNVLHSSNLYSYAFIFGPRPKSPNFSFTIDMV
jgi:hypothetical protein